MLHHTQKSGIFPLFSRLLRCSPMAKSCLMTPVVLASPPTTFFVAWPSTRRPPWAYAARTPRPLVALPAFNQPSLLLPLTACLRFLEFSRLLSTATTGTGLLSASPRGVFCQPLASFKAVGGVFSLEAKMGLTTGRQTEDRSWS